MRAQRLLALALLLATGSSFGCEANFWDPTRFPPLHSEGQVQVTHDPGASPFPLGRYGAVVVGYASLLPDPSIIIPGTGRSPNLIASRFVVSGGASSAFYVWRGFEDRATSDTTTTGLRPALNATAIYDGCRDREFCGDGASSAIAAFDVLPAGNITDEAEFSCVAVPAGAVGMVGGSADERLLVRCETASNRILPVNVEDGIDFGASAVGLPAVRGDGCAPRPHGVGVALFGAPRGNAQDGALFVARATPGIAVTEIDLGALDLPANASLGAAIAAIPLDENRALVAVSARSEEALAAPMVVVMTLTGSDVGVSAEVHACLGGAGINPGFGRSVAVGDLSGDDSPEIVVGGGARVAGVASELEEPLQIYAFSALSTLHLSGCAGDTAPAPAHVIECDDVEGLSCADASIVERTPTGFGAALAIGDLDADGIGDLVVGAPHARIRGVNSGAVVSLRGAATLSAVGMGAASQAAIAPSNARAGMLLGYAVTTLRGTDRDEIVAGAPGVGDAMVFFCSGLPGDRAADLREEDGVTRGCVLSVLGGATPRCTASPDAGMPDTGTPDDAGVPDDAGEPDAP
jgi:hypothetical protein